MSWNLEDTIVAIATAPGGAHRGVIRMSGPRLLQCLSGVFELEQDTPLSEILVPTVVSGRLRLDSSHAILDCKLYLWPTASSYTRKPVAELHTIGSPPLLEAALRTICKSGGRLAEPGEFTLRAFLSGRLDLTQAEAVLGVIDAQSQQQLDVALGQLAGSLSAPLHDLRDMLLELLSHLEAGLDFVEEEIEFISAAEVDRQLTKAIDTIDRVNDQWTSRGEVAREQRVVLMGWPNVGKSSLLNALTGKAASLVSTRPGTTRDYVSRTFDLFGTTCQLIDTAGMQSKFIPGGIAAVAQEFTAQQIQLAQLQILCIDSTRPLNEWERSQLELDSPIERIVVITKTDRPRGTDLEQPFLETSSLTREGIEQLRRTIHDRLMAARHCETTVVAATSARCSENIRQARACLERARQLVVEHAGEEIMVVELRSALNQIGGIVGAVYTDDILDRIFSRFCIGK